MSQNQAAGNLSSHDIRQLRAMLHMQNIPNEWLDYEALLVALHRGNMRAANFLLSRGCRVSKPDSSEQPLHLAVAKLGWFNIVEKLLAVGARVTDLDEKGDTALHVAFFNYASDNVIDLLLERYLQETAENLSDEKGISFLHIACTRANVEIIRDFVARGQADVNSQVSTPSKSIFAGCTPLHFAAEYSQPDMVKFLLEHNAELYARDCNGSSPLHYALERRDVEIVDLILSYDRRHENIVNDFGLSHFMAACSGTNEEIVHEFLRVAEFQSRASVSALINDACKDLNYYKYAGYTSSVFAAEFGRNGTVQLLNILAEQQSTRARPFPQLGEDRRQVTIQAKRSGRPFGSFCNFIALVLFFALSFPSWLVMKCAA